MSLLPSFFTVRVAGAPLPYPFVIALKSIEVSTSTDQASIFRMEFELSKTATGDWDITQFDLFLPLVPISISVNVTPFLREVLINGYVHDAHLDNHTSPGKSTLQVTGMDALGTLMTL